MEALGMILFFSIIVTMCLMSIVLVSMDTTVATKPEVTTTHIPPVKID